MSLLVELQGLMAEYRFRPNHGMSQNFIIDESLIESMISAADLKKNDVVLEVGCGTGFLTQRLLEHCKVVGYEKDEKMAEILQKKFGENENFKLVQEDFVSAKLPKFTKFVSLPPYNISTALVIKLFSAAPKRSVIVLQKEFVEKLIAEPGFWDYNYISVLTLLRFNPFLIIKNIRPKSFFPSPESFSSLIYLEGKKSARKIDDEETFVFFVKTIFRYKNKNLSNAIRNSLNDLERKIKINKKKLNEILADENLTSEKVSLIEPEVFAEIFMKISQ